MFFVLDTSCPSAPTELTYKAVLASILKRRELQLRYTAPPKPETDTNAADDDAMDLGELAQALQHEEHMRALQGERPEAWLVDIHVRNVLLQNLSRARFRDMFSDYLRHTGYVRRSLTMAQQPTPAQDTDEASGSTSKAAPSLVPVEMSYMDTRSLTEEQLEELEPLVHRSLGTAEDRFLVEKYYFQQKVVNTDASEEDKADVFDQMEAKRALRKLLDNKFYEVNSNGTCEARLKARGNPYLITWGDRPPALGLLATLCGLLGVRSTHDQTTLIPAARFKAKAKELWEVVNNLLELLRPARFKESAKAADGTDETKPRRTAITRVLREWGREKLATAKRSQPRNAPEVVTYQIKLDDKEGFIQMVVSLVERRGAGLAPAEGEEAADAAEAGALAGEDE